MATARLCLLLLLPLGCCQRSVSQITEWIGEVEGSGKTSSVAYLTCCGFYFCNIRVCKRSNFVSLYFFCPVSYRGFACNYFQQSQCHVLLQVRTIGFLNRIWKMIHTGLAQHPFALEAVGRVTRSWGGIPAETPAVAGWATSPCAEVRPPPQWDESNPHSMHVNKTPTWVTLCPLHPPALHGSELWEARCGLQWSRVWQRLVGGLCGEVRLPTWLHAPGKPNQILPVWRPLDSKTSVSQWVHTERKASKPFKHSLTGVFSLPNC